MGCSQSTVATKPQKDQKKALSFCLSFERVEELSKGHRIGLKPTESHEVVEPGEINVKLDELRSSITIGSRHMESDSGERQKAEVLRQRSLRLSSRRTSTPGSTRSCTDVDVGLFG